ncbi:MAG: hypothetical protein JWM11_5740 [Planctomycetaceae bacterium]|nr:hypothetical protein [Planctomycetaceae bacterium]
MESGRNRKFQARVRKWLKNGSPHLIPKSRLQSSADVRRAPRVSSPGWSELGCCLIPFEHRVWFCFSLNRMRKGQGTIMLQSFLHDEAGAIVSIEIILIITIAVLALIVGWSEIAVAVNTELNDISNAVGALNQSFAFTGFHDNIIFGGNKNISFFSGSSFTDRVDDCDFNLSCDLVCGFQNNTCEL